MRSDLHDLQLMHLIGDDPQESAPFIGPSATAGDVISITPNSGAIPRSKCVFALVDMP